MGNKKYKFKPTAQILADLKRLAGTFPEIQRLEDGVPKFTTRVKKVSYNKLSEEDKFRFAADESFRKQKGAAPFKHTVRWKVPVLFDHYKELYEAYRTEGMEGVKGYTDFVNEVTTASNNAASSVQPVEGPQPENQLINSENPAQANG